MGSKTRRKTVNCVGAFVSRDAEGFFSIEVSETTVIMKSIIYRIFGRWIIPAKKCVKSGPWWDHQGSQEQIIQDFAEVN